MITWYVQREQRSRAAERNDYGWLPCPVSIRHAIREFGMQRETANQLAFQSMHQRDPARWGGPGA